MLFDHRTLDAGTGAERPQLARLTGAILLLFLAYAAAGWLGLRLAVPPGYATMIWPASGLAIGALILYGLQLWPGVLLGAFAVNALHSGALAAGHVDVTGLAVAVLIAVGSTLQSVVATSVVVRLYGRPLKFVGLKGLGVFMALTGPVVCTIAPSVGVGVLWSAGIVPDALIVENWLTWWIGDAAGVLIFMPIVLFNPWRPWAVEWSGLALAGFSVPMLVASIVPLGATFYAWKLTSEAVFERDWSDFERLAEVSERALVHRMESYRLSLDGAAGLFGDSQRVTIDEWRAYTEVLEIESTLPGINGIGFIVPVERADIDEFIDTADSLGIPDLSIHPETTANDLFVIVYVEPLAPNLAARGLDIAFEQNRRDAAIHARDSGRSTITRRVLLVQDETASPGFLLLRPLYRTNVSHSTVTERRAAFLGWVYAPFIGNRFLADLTSRQGIDLDISVYDGAAEDPGSLIYTSRDGQERPGQPIFRLATTLEMMERDWTIIWESTPHFEARTSSAEPLLILVSGIALSALFAALLLSYARREDLVRRIVLQKTRKIAAQEQENSSIVNSAIVGIIVLDAEGTILSMNAATEKIFGLQTKDAVSKPMGELIEGIDGSLLRRMTQAETDTASGQDVPDLFVARRGDGTRGYLDLQVNRWMTENSAVRYTAVIRDVTQAKKAADDLTDAEHRWNFALKSGRIGVFDVDLATGKSIVSDSWKILLGFSVDEEIDPQREFWSRVHPDDLPILRAANQAAVDGRADRSVTEFRLRNRKDETIHLRSDAVIAERADDGTALRLLGTMVDITLVKLAATSLRISEERFRSAFENAPIGKAMVDLHGRMISANGALCQFLGYAKGELLTHDFRDIVSAPNPVLGCNILDVVAGSRDHLYQAEHQFVHADGRRLWGLLNVSHVSERDDEPDYLIVQVIDIHDRKEMDRMKSEFVATISHELRTPLTSIRGSLGLLTNVLSREIPETALKLLTIAHKNCDRIIALVNDFLDLEKMASDTLRFDIRPYSLGPLIEQAVESNQGYANQFDVTLEISPSDSRAVVMVDEARFHQVLSNLLSNAAKFSPPGGKVTVSITERDGRVRVGVADRGVGISPEFRQKIFQRFSQEDSSATRDKGGTGLGLHISRQMTERMGGIIDFQSQSGAGTVFWVDLPDCAVTAPSH